MQQNDQPLENNPVSYSPGYLRYALGLMFVVILFNFVDRFALNILIHPIQMDTGLSDAHMGLLTGIAFALVFATVGIPIGRLADRHNRVYIIASAVVVWSACTALFGCAANYLYMVLARIGVAAGETGGSTPLYSIVGDNYPPEKRSSAMAVLLLGAGVGVVFSQALAGYMNDQIGWRLTFVVLGASGFVIAPLVLFTLKEPQRGHSDGLNIDSLDARETFTQAVLVLWRRRAFLWMCIGAGITGMGVMGVQVWIPTFFLRKFQVSTTEMGMYLAVISVPHALSILCGGILADRLYRKNPRWILWLPGIAVIVAAPAALLQLVMPSIPLALAVAIIPSIASGAYSAPLVAACQAIGGARLRATATAFMSFAMSLVGMGLGPSFVGIVSQLLLPVVKGDPIWSLGLAICCAVPFFIGGGTAFLIGSRNFEADVKRARDYDINGGRRQI